MDNSQKSETKSSERLPQAEPEPSQVPQVESSPSKEAQFSELPEETKLAAEKLVSGQEVKPEPQPSVTGQKVGPKVQVGQTPMPPSLEALMRQKSIDVALQTESIGKKICKLQGHNIQPMNLRATVPDPKELGKLFLTETTIVICTRCGASLVQVRG